ncbi:MAG: hypothetical protein ABIS68_11050 [Casimicrobiaceae bacterium]
MFSINRKVATSVLVSCATSLWASIACGAAEQPYSPPTLAEVGQRLAGISVPFIENAGQLEPRIRFVAPTFAGTLVVTETGELIYALPGATPHVITETFVGTRALPKAGIPHHTNVSSFIGADASKHRAHVRTYEHITLDEVFPGIHVKLRATGRNVEKIFTVGPRQDPSRIQLEIGGADRIALSEDGRLIVSTSEGDIAFTAPIAYQTIDGRQAAVHVAYALDPASRRYGFAVGRYDREQPLVIDPLLQATYLGGSTGVTQIRALAVHPVTGEVLVAGSTSSTNLPCTTAGGSCSNAAQSANAGDIDSFVARLNPALTSLLQVTYLGGSAIDQVAALVVHPASGEVLVAGYTQSANFPCTFVAGICNNGGQNFYAGNEDGFVARFNANLTGLLQATFVGGSSSERINAIAVHPLNGNVLVAGYTNSSDLPCTVTGGLCGPAAQATNGGGRDAFVARFNANLTNQLQTTYFGGSLTDVANAISVHPVSGDVLVAGSTNSTNLPCTTAGAICGNGAQTTSGGAGPDDGFVARFNATLTGLLQATYLGGANGDAITAMTVHPGSGEVLVAGATYSTNLPCTTAAGGCSPGAQPASGGPTDGFVARLNPRLTNLLQLTYLGGAGLEDVSSIAVHPTTGEVLVGGSTTSTNFPCTTAVGLCGNGAQTANLGANDGFIVRFDASLTKLLQSTYFGGTLNDDVSAIAVHPSSGEVYFAGSSASSDLPCTTVASGCGVAAQSARASVAVDGYVARVSPDLTLADTTPNPFAFTSQNAVPLATLRTSTPVQISGISGNVPIYVEGQLGSAYCISASSSCGCGAFATSPGTISNNQFVCVQHISAPSTNRVTETVLHVGGGAGAFRVATGTLLSVCSLDVDGNGSIDALTDGLLILRAMFGLTGTSVTNNAVGSGAARASWAQIHQFLNGNCGTNFAP